MQEIRDESKFRACGERNEQHNCKSCRSSGTPLARGRNPKPPPSSSGELALPPSNHIPPDPQGSDSRERGPSSTFPTSSITIPKSARPVNVHSKSHHRNGIAKRFRPRGCLPRRPQNPRSLARTSQSTEPLGALSSLSPRAPPKNPRLRLLADGPIPLSAPPTRHAAQAGRRARGVDHPARAPLPGRRGLAATRPAPAREQREGDGRGREDGQLDLPVRADVLRRHEAQGVRSRRGRHADHRADPQRRQRAGVAGDQGVGEGEGQRGVRLLLLLISFSSFSFLFIYLFTHSGRPPEYLVLTFHVRVQMRWPAISFLLRPLVVAHAPRPLQHPDGLQAAFRPPRLGRRSLRHPGRVRD